MFDIIFFVIFLGAASAVAVMLWRKIPILLQVPEQLIEESFATRPSRIKHVLDPLTNFFRERGYRTFLHTAAMRSLTRVRLWLLRLERFVFRMIESLEARSRRWSELEGHYWSTLKEWKQDEKGNGNHIPDSVFNPEPPPSSSVKNTPEDQPPA